MSHSEPAICTNPNCGQPDIRLIHRSSARVAIDAVDGAPVYAEHLTYRCSQCGHTWANRGYSFGPSHTPGAGESAASGA